MYLSQKGCILCVKSETILSWMQLCRADNVLTHRCAHTQDWASALVVAVHNGQLEIVQVLLNGQANVNLQDKVDRCYGMIFLP
jgi:hypothetical protein